MFASAWEDLPQDIIEAILYRLPAKSVGRFKSVSKTWRSLISEPNFIKTYYSFHQTTKSIIVSSFIGALSLYSIDTNQLLRYLNNSDDSIDMFAIAIKLEYSLLSWGEHLVSCNGLVLTKTFNSGTMLLTNPTTKELWNVPPSPFDSDRRWFSSCCGFSYDSITDDYKLVWISYPKDNGDTYISLYSLRNNSWKKLPNPPRLIFKEFSGGALVNHNYHWLTSSTTEVIVFSFADEAFSEIELPDVFQNRNILYSKVVEFGGKLGVWDGCELWVMHEYGNSKSWTRVFSHVFSFPVIPVCSVEGSNNRHIILKDISGLEIVVFNIDKKICRNVKIVGGPSGFYIRGTFAESIESSKRIITTP